MWRYLEQHIRTGAIVLLVVITLAYALFQSRNLIAGPQITVLSPSSGTATTSLVHIYGRAEHISFITLNDREIFLNERGEFEEKLLLQKGYTILTLKARDKFGRQTRETIELVYK